MALQRTCPHQPPTQALDMRTRGPLQSAGPRSSLPRVTTAHGRVWLASERHLSCRQLLARRRLRCTSVGRHGRLSFRLPRRSLLQTTQRRARTTCCTTRRTRTQACGPLLIACFLCQARPCILSAAVGLQTTQFSTCMSQRRWHFWTIQLQQRPHRHLQRLQQARASVVSPSRLRTQCGTWRQDLQPRR